MSTVPTNKEQIIIYLAASGLNQAEIANEVGLSPQAISKALSEERIQFELRKLRHKLFGKDIQRKFRDMVPAAQEIMQEILTQPNIKPQLKFNAAQEVFDRALGKPKQTIEHEGSMIKRIYEKLDERGASSTIDVTPEMAADAEPIALPTNPNTNPEPPVDAIDQWANENL
jgi:predicted transcriptional regulator